MKLTTYFTLLVIPFLTHCTAPIEETTQTDLAAVPGSWIEERVASTKEQLMQSDAGQVVWQAMEAHGGLTTWYENGPIQFRFNYQPLDGSTPRDSYQTIDTWRSKARHEVADNREHQYGWDGEQAWVFPDTLNMPYNTRFWSLTPYFFMAQPFLLGNEGTNLELLPSLTYEGQEQDVIKVTFDAGVGDAPDDYYVMYFGQDDHELQVIRYIVSYPGYFEKGKHLPEKIMTLSGKQEVDGILFPKAYQTHWWTNDSIGEHITTITLSSIVFLPETKESYFDVPTAARVLKEL
jgi:hypothetical protein